MKGKAPLRSLLTEYGVLWAFNRAAYGCKLRLLSMLPRTERWFETKAGAEVLRTDIFEPDTAAVGAFLRALPEKQRSELLQRADAACEGRILGFSSIELDYGYPLDWQLNPLTGKRADAGAKWYRIPDFDRERGDIKVTWEASRFAHFHLFTRAYLLTSDEKYYRAFSGQLNDWLAANPYPYGANYKCGQECAIRLINGLLAYAVFAKAGAAGARDEGNIEELISRCYRKILSNFFYAYRCIRNNHTISELAGMIVGAWCCGDESRVEKAYGMLDKVICRQFTADGGYAQFSFNYQRLALQDIECILCIEKKTGRRLSADALERARRSCLLLYQCQNADGRVPNYGSNDGALIFPVTSCGYLDYRPVINSVYALTAGLRLYDAGPWDEELLWFAGGFQGYPVSAPERVSSFFPEAGLGTLRSARGFLLLVLNDYRSRPAHMDQMHIDIWMDGVNVFCDSGTYSYAGELGRALAATGGHNTVKASGLEQMNRCGAFMLCDWTVRKEALWRGGRFDGVMASRNGYEHRRRVEMDERGYTIADEVRVKEARPVEALYHTPCEVTRTADGLLLSDHGRPLCLMRAEAGEIEIEEARRSLYYLRSETVHVIRVRGTEQNGLIKITVRILYGNGEI